jgi:uncharacterized protein (UPF0264 family)
MRLLVSVRSAPEAQAALAGGADIIDAKEPLNGALGPVTPRVLRSITAAVAGAAPVSVALGDAGQDKMAVGARTAASAGVAFAKVGFAGVCDPHHITRNVSAVRRLVRPAGVILVAYADHERAGAPSPDDLISIGQQMRAAGILLDTCDKRAAGLTALMTGRALRAFVTRAQSHGLIVALAGRLTADDIDLVREAGADIAGVRGAACDGGRSGVVSADRVRALRIHIDRAVRAAC